jgi:formate hydrogenlyase subunit 6/NADH:ubiquinone oxidoreductase subunit I
MKSVSMLTDVIHSLFGEPATQKYPFERRETPGRLRSSLHWDSEKCTGCGLCATDCPANAIEMIVLDKKAKRFVLVYHADRCTFCAQCEFSCRQGCLELSSQEWELAALCKSPFVIYYGDQVNIDEALQATEGTG